MRRSSTEGDAVLRQSVGHGGFWRYTNALHRVTHVVADVRSKVRTDRGGFFPIERVEHEAVVAAVLEEVVDVARRHRLWGLRLG